LQLDFCVSYYFFDLEVSILIISNNLKLTGFIVFMSLIPAESASSVISAKSFVNATIEYPIPLSRISL
jgi:hypothetical protein